jgi:hypothetical protein
MAPELLVPDSFGAWLRSSRRRLAIPPITIGVPAILTALNWLRSAPEPAWLRPSLVGLQLLAIIGLVLLLPEPLVDRTNNPRASVVADQFSHWWRMLWLFWLFEYIVLFAREILSALPSPERSPWATATWSTCLNLANNLPTVALILCYYITTTRTIRNDGGRFASLRLPWHKIVSVVALLAVLELLVRLTPLLEPLVPAFPAETASVFDWISGISAGLATALLAGRLDSRFIRLSPIIVTLMYLYAVLQAAWPTFGDNPDTRIVIVNVALALKILLFAIVYWLFRSGVLLFYLHRAAEAYEQGPTERYEFVARLQQSLGMIKPEPAMAERRRLIDRRAATPPEMRPPDTPPSGDNGPPNY